MQTTLKPLDSTAEPKRVRDWWRTERAKRVGTAVLAALLIGLIYWFFAVRPFVSTDDARIAATLVRVAPEGIGGRVLKLNVDEGARVKKGDVVMELDHQTTNAQLEKAKAHAALAEHELTRVTSLASHGGVAARELDVARANSQAAIADLNLAQVASENTFIRSPINGIVVQKVAEEGNIVEPGQTVVTIAQVDDAWVAANIEETRVGRVKIGDPVKIWIDEGGELTGKISEIRNATASQFALIPAENPSGNFTKLVQRIPIKVALDPHPDMTLRAGESVEIRIRVR